MTTRFYTRQHAYGNSGLHMRNPFFVFAFITFTTLLPWFIWPNAFAPAPNRILSVAVTTVFCICTMICFVRWRSGEPALTHMLKCPKGLQLLKQGNELQRRLNALQAACSALDSYTNMQDDAPFDTAITAVNQRITEEQCAAQQLQDAQKAYLRKVVQNHGHQMPIWICCD